MHESRGPARRAHLRRGGDGAGDGRAVLFLHGFPQTSFSWHHQLEALGAAGYRALAFDQRGYSPGARPAAVEDYRIDELVADVLAVADALGARALRPRRPRLGCDGGLGRGRSPSRPGPHAQRGVGAPSPRLRRRVRRGGAASGTTARGRGPAPAVVVHRGVPGRGRGGRAGPARATDGSGDGPAGHVRRQRPLLGHRRGATGSSPRCSSPGP